MSRVVSRAFVLAALAVVCAVPALGQQHKISYQKFDWQVYKSAHFDVHYYPETEQFLEDIVSYAESAYIKISQDLDHELRFRVPLITYKTHGEFEQTNITLGDVPEGVGAFAEPIQYRMVLPIDMPADKLYKLIAHELTHIFEYSMFFEGYFGRTLRSNPPTWIMEGLASYLADDEDNIDRMAIRDAVVNNILPPIQSLNVVTFLTYRYGHAIFDFIEQENGKEGLRSFLFEFKKVLMTGQLGRAIKEAFGYDIDEFNRRFNRYLRRKYFPVLLEKKSPDEYGTEIGIKRRGVYTFSPSLSPSGELVAALASPKMELDLVVLNAEDGTKVRNVTKGWTNNYRGLQANAFEGKRDLSWSPVADHIAVFVRREDKWPLLIFNALNGKIVHDFPLKGISQSGSPAYSPDGTKIAFEGNVDGIVDIYEIDLATQEVRNLTQDDFFDTNPWYSPDGETLLYNRRIGEHWKIFIVDLEDSSKKTQLTYGQFNDLQPSYSRDAGKIYFTSDRGPYGVFNIHSLDLTTGDLAQYTDVVGGTFAPSEMSERDGEPYLVFQAYFEGTFRLYRMPIGDPELEIEATARLSEPNEAAPFEPAMRLTADEAKKQPYKLKWDVQAPSVGVGVADDGTFLSNAAIGFTDLLGNHRISILANSVSDFAAINASYFNLKRRYNWGGSIYDYRDFFYVETFGQVDKLENRVSGATAFIEYPINRYHSVGASVGLQDSSQQFLQQTQFGILYDKFEDTLGLVSVNYRSNTARYQRFGPFNGRVVNLGVTFGPQISGDSEGDLLQYNLDFRVYKQMTRRSLIAWRVGSLYSAGELEYTYGYGGLNNLRGWDYREFNGSRLAWTNFELRFPLVDEMRFPFLRLAQIRGMLFADVGMAWYDDDLWYDPEVGRIRTDANGIVAARFMNDGDLQDGRASFGWGFQFLFLGGLQFNWVWAQRMDYLQYQYLGPDAGTFQKVDAGGTRMDFYIMYDW
jgi:Tol biopolymer transport system component